MKDNEYENFLRERFFNFDSFEKQCFYGDISCGFHMYGGLTWYD